MPTTFNALSAYNPAFVPANDALVAANSLAIPASAGTISPLGIIAPSFFRIETGLTSGFLVLNYSKAIFSSRIFRFYL